MDYTFRPATKGQLPTGAAPNGSDRTASGSDPSWIARSLRDTPNLPGVQLGKFRPGLGAAFPFNREEIFANPYEVMMEPGTWVGVPQGRLTIPIGAIFLGEDQDGGPLYAARAAFQGAEWRSTGASG